MNKQQQQHLWKLQVMTLICNEESFATIIITVVYRLGCAPSLSSRNTLWLIASINLLKYLFIGIHSFKLS